MLSIYQNIHFSKTVLMPQERKVHDVKWEKQDTVPYMQYDLNCEIFIHLKKKKTRRKMHHLASFVSVEWNHKISRITSLFLLRNSPELNWDSWTV